MIEKKENNDIYLDYENHRCISGHCKPNQRAIFGKALKNSQGKITFKKFDVFTSSEWGNYYGIIYRIIDTNKDNSLQRRKFYIGRTIQKLKERFRQHFKSPPNSFLAKAFARYNKRFTIVENGIINDSMSYRTKGGEFIIEVLKYCIDVDSINKNEIDEIERHQSWITKYGTHYGYNINRGGGDRGVPKEGQKGEDHYRWINIDEGLLIQLIQKGLLLDEIAGEFGTSTPTIERRIRDFKIKYSVKNITEARKLFGGEQKANKRRSYINSMAHPNKKIILDEDMIEQIELLKTRLEIQKILKIGHVQFYDKLNEMGYEGLDDIRDDLGVLEDYKKQYAERLSRSLSKDVDIDKFIEAIISGLNKEELEEKFGIGDILFYKTLKKIGYDSLPIARKDLGGQLNFEFRRYIKYSKHVLEALNVLLKNNKDFTAQMLGESLNISENGAYHHISKHLIRYGLVEELPNQEYRKKRRYRLTNFGNELLYKLFS